VHSNWQLWWKPNWYVLLCWCACLYHSLIVVQPTWTTVPCPTIKLSLLLSKSFVGIKQSVISVALKTPLKNKIGNLYLQNFTSASARWLYWFYIKLSPHILQQNCAHGMYRCKIIMSSHFRFFFIFFSSSYLLREAFKCLLYLELTQSLNILSESLGHACTIQKARRAKLSTWICRGPQKIYFISM